MSKVLVIGSLGTVGVPLCRALAGKGAEVWEADVRTTHRDERFVRADLGEYREIAHALDYVGVDSDWTVVNLAAEFGRINGEERYGAMWRTNVIGFKNLLSLQEKIGFAILHASSSEVYGSGSETRLHEDEVKPGAVVVDAACPAPLNDYAISKLANELQAENARRRNHEVGIVRLFNCYGPGESYHPRRSVVCLFLYRLLLGRPIQVHTGHRRDFLYIDDAVEGLSRFILDRGLLENSTLNLGSNETLSIEELAAACVEVTGADPSLVELLDPEVGNSRTKIPDSSRAGRDLGWSAETPLREGLRRTIEWMRTEYPALNLTSPRAE